MEFMTMFGIIIGFYLELLKGSQCSEVKSTITSGLRYTNSELLSVRYNNSVFTSLDTTVLNRIKIFWY